MVEVVQLTECPHRGSTMFCRSVQLQAGSSAPEKTVHGEPAEKPGMKGAVEARGDCFLMTPLNRVSFLFPLPTTVDREIFA